MKIRLETRNGGLVHKSQIPPFFETPDVIGYGDRVFVRLDIPTDPEASADERVVLYRECFCVSLTDNLNR